MNKKFGLFIILLCLISSIKAQEINLNDHWVFRNIKETKTYPAIVPGTIHGDLLLNKLIPDPYVSTNIDSVQWVEKQDWEYTCTFDFDTSRYGKSRVSICFDGIDTYGSVYLNGKLLGKANNMFRTWRFYISGKLKPKNNKLEVRLYSASRIADSLARVYPYKLPCENTRNFIRKAQYHFGWDFAPRLVTCGIWRDVKLELNYAEVAGDRVMQDVRLVQDPDSTGKSFYFKINGKPVFMKGANWVPADMLLPNVTDDKYRNLLIAAKEAGVNMLRIWGGGVYEKNIFYELCDSLRIYIWQDLMFAGAMYPSDSAFVKNVMQEVCENVSRLRKYNCIVLWSGNNEIDEAWNNWGWQKEYQWSDSISKKIWAGYKDLFENRIPALIKELNTRPYVSSSPKYGWGKSTSLTEGDMHYWGVWWGLEPIQIYNKKIPHFMSEYGMQSMPDMESIKKFSEKKDWDISSKVMLAHQRHPKGFQTLAHYLKDERINFTDFESYILATQELQSRAVKTAAEAHINAKPYCMGTLVWQWNDCWPAISWSIIDYYGNRKKAYETLKGVYSR